MYLVPWQIFVLGCMCGIFIAFFICVLFIFRIALRGGVRMEKIEKREENEDNG